MEVELLDGALDGFKARVGVSVVEAAARVKGLEEGLALAVLGKWVRKVA